MKYLIEERITPDAARALWETVRSVYEPRDAEGLVDPGAPRNKPEDEKPQHPWAWRTFSQRNETASNGLLVVDIGGKRLGFCGEQAEALEAMIAGGGSAVSVDHWQADVLTNLQVAGVPIWPIGKKMARLTGAVTVIARRRYGQGTPMRAAEYCSIHRGVIG